VKKIVIFGSPGSGKTELASQLGDKLGVSKSNVFFLDRGFWTKDWKPTEGRRDILEKMFLHDNWIIEGNFSETIGRLLENADTVIHLQISRYACLWRITKKWIGYAFKFRIPNIDGTDRKDRLTRKYIKDIWGYAFTEGKILNERIESTKLIYFPIYDTKQLSFFLDNAPNLLESWMSNQHGIIALRQGDEVAARGAFVRAITQADEILAKTPDYYSALDAKGLALCGLVLCRGAVPAPDDAPTNNMGRGDPPLRLTMPLKPSARRGRLLHMWGLLNPYCGCSMSWSSAMRRGC
jgi:adenylate kinase family enzyme